MTTIETIKITISLTNKENLNKDLSKKYKMVHNQKSNKNSSLSKTNQIPIK